MSTTRSSSATRPIFCVAGPGDDVLLARKKRFKHLDLRLALRHGGKPQSTTVLGAEARTNDHGAFSVARDLRQGNVSSEDPAGQASDNTLKVGHEFQEQELHQDPDFEHWRPSSEACIFSDCFHGQACSRLSSGANLAQQQQEVRQHFGELCEDASFQCSSSAQTAESAPKNVDERLQIGMPIERSSGATRPLKACMAIPGDDVLLAKKKLVMSHQERLAMRRFGKLQSPYCDNGPRSFGVGGKGIEFQPSLNERRNRFDRIPNRM
jgi:hypothetical protein